MGIPGDASSTGNQAVPATSYAGARSTRAFFALTFSASWVLWSLAAWISPATGTVLSSFVRPALILLGTIMPSIVALVLARRAEGEGTANAMLARIGRWRVPLRFYVFAISYIALIKLTVALLIRIGSGAWPRFGDTPIALMALVLLGSTWVQAGEEVGWRGYALPRLASGLGLGRASLLLGVIWALWHLPIFFFPDADTAGQSFALYLLQVTALSVAMAWLYWRTDGSLLLVMLFHAAVNNTKDIVPSALPGATNSLALEGSLAGWLTVALLWLSAAFLLVRMRGVHRATGETPDDDRLQGADV